MSNIWPTETINSCFLFPTQLSTSNINNTYVKTSSRRSNSTNNNSTRSISSATTSTNNATTAAASNTTTTATAATMNSCKECIELLFPKILINEWIPHHPLSPGALSSVHSYSSAGFQSQQCSVYESTVLVGGTLPSQVLDIVNTMTNLLLDTNNSNSNNNVNLKLRNMYKDIGIRIIVSSNSNNNNNNSNITGNDIYVISGRYENDCLCINIFKEM